MDEIPAPVLGVAVVVAVAVLALTGYRFLRLWSAGEALDGAPGRASPRPLTGLLVGTACFMAGADVAVIGLWALLGGDF